MKHELTPEPEPEMSCAPVERRGETPAPSARSGVGSTSAAAPPLEELLRHPRRPSSAPEAPFVGFCVDPRHPNRLGRALIRWAGPGSSQPEERWLPCMRALALREGDRVMVALLSNFDEPVVVGVLDGFTPRPEPSVTASHVIELKADERLRVHASDGTPLIEIQPTAEGPVVSLLSRELGLRVPGTLTLDAEAIELRARRGPVGITASDDVEINGELIRLNSSKEAGVASEGEP